MSSEIIRSDGIQERTSQTAARALSPAQSGSPTPAELLSRAVASGADIAVLEKLMALQERYEANQSRKAFDAAIADAKAAMPKIVKDAQGHNSKYAPFATIAAAVDPVLSANGLSYRFRTAQADKISVTCILSHRDGHSEETTLSAPPDTGPGRNALQAIGSTLTYLQRYSLVQALGLAAAPDDDGKAAGSSETIDEGQIESLQRAIMEADADLPRFLKYFDIQKLDDLLAKDFDRALQAIHKSAEKRKGAQ